MKVDQIMLEQLDAALNGSVSSGSGKGNGEFAAVLDKALTGEAKENSKGSSMSKNGEFAAASDNKEVLPITEQKVPENEKGLIDKAELEEKLELLMLRLLKSDQAVLEKYAASKEQQNGRPVEDKIIAAFKGDKISAEGLKEDLVAKIDQQVKQAGGLKDEALVKKSAADATGIKGEAKGEAELKAKKAFAENEAGKEVTQGAASKKDLPGQTAEKQTDLRGKTSEPEANRPEKAGKKPEQAVKGSKEEVKIVTKDTASKKDLPGQTAEKQTDLKGKTSESEANRPESAGKKPEQAVKESKEEVKIVTKDTAYRKDLPGQTAEKQADLKGKTSDPEASRPESPGKKAKVTTEQSSEKSTDQQAARVNNARQDTTLNQGRNESNRAETNTQRSQNVSPAQDQNFAQQSTVRGDEALQGSRVLNAQNANLRESVMQQLQGRMTYLRESGNNPAEMRVTLHPPELGEVTVRVFSSKGRLSASIIAETPLAREILESSITELRQRMNFVNIQFDQLDVSTAGKEYEGFDRPGDREGSGKAEFGETERNVKSSAESEPPPQQVSPGDSGSGIDFWA